MTTISTEEIINEIKAEETAALSRGNKLFSIRPIIKTTKEFPKDHKEKSYAEPFVIRKNRRSEIIGLTTMALVFTLAFGYVVFTQKEVNIIGSLLVTALFISMYYVFYQSLTRPSLNYTITLTSRQIDFGDMAFSWDDIQETFIVYRSIGKGYRIFLILGLTNGELIRHDLNIFMTFQRGEQDIATAIEHFKKMHHS